MKKGQLAGLPLLFDAAGRCWRTGPLYGRRGVTPG